MQIGISNHLPDPIERSKLESIHFDICFGGMFYVIVDADRYHLDLKPENGRLLSQIGEMLKADAQEKFAVNHPDFDYPGPDILAFTSTKTGRHINTVVMSNGSFDWTRPSSWNAMLDRSPCGSGRVLNSCDSTRFQLLPVHTFLLIRLVL